MFTILLVGVRHYLYQFHLNISVILLDGTYEFWVISDRGHGRWFSLGKCRDYKLDEYFYLSNWISQLLTLYMHTCILWMLSANSGSTSPLSLLFVSRDRPMVRWSEENALEKSLLEFSCYLLEQELRKHHKWPYACKNKAVFYCWHLRESLIRCCSCQFHPCCLRF